MQTTAISKEDKKEFFESIMALIKAPEGYSKYEYYGTMHMVRKKNGYYYVRLMYDYSKSAINSNEIEVETFNDFIMALNVLEEFKKVEAKSKRLSFGSKKETANSADKLLG